MPRIIWSALIGAVICACFDGSPGDGTAVEPEIPQISGSWTFAAPIPQAIQELHAAFLRSHIYIAGGIDDNNLTTSVAFRYDVSADAWEQIANLPSGRHHMPLAVANDTLYAVGGLISIAGGFRAENNLWIYDEANDGWLARTVLPRPRGASAVGVVGGQILVAGGYADGGQLIDSIHIYDPVTNAWRKGAPIPTPRDHLAGAVVNGIFYLLGGRRVSVGATLALVEAYDLATDSWTTLASMPTDRGGLGAAVLGQRIFAVGGEPAQEMLVANEAYDVVTDTWAIATPVPTGRHGLALVGVDGSVFAIGGGPVAGFAQTSVVEVFTPLP